MASTTSSEAVEVGSCAPSTASSTSSSVAAPAVANGFCPPSRMQLLASHNNYPPIPWFHESWLRHVIRYERIATASPRLGVGILGHELARQHMHMLPTLHSTVHLLHVFDARGSIVATRPKSLTWPLTKQEASAVEAKKPAGMDEM